MSVPLSMNGISVLIQASHLELLKSKFSHFTILVIFLFFDKTIVASFIVIGLIAITSVRLIHF
jgi:hypothetical protein